MEKYLKNIKEAIIKENVLWSKHADKERFKDELSFDEVLESIMNGEIIEEYSDDKPLPSCLISGKSNNKNIHIVVGYNKTTEVIRIITVYIPSLDIWNNDFKTRRKEND